jgi:HAD superfamily hydrolase (TIGR01509 family)
VTFLVFDMDGVLVDTSECHARAYRDLWERCGVTGPPYPAIAGRPTVEVVRELVRAGEIGELVRFKQQRAREYMQSEDVIYADVAPALTALHAAGLGMGVATGASRATAEMLLQRAGVADYLRFVLAAEDVRAGKPDPEVYLLARELAGTDDVLVIEDSASGLAAAVAAGTRVACVRSGLRVESPLFAGSFAGLPELARSLGVAA